MSDKKYLSSQIDWLREQLRPYCNKRSQKLIACAVELAISDVMADRGIVLDGEFCNRYGLPEPMRTLEYTYEQSLFVVLTHDSFYPDFSAIKGKFSPTAIYAATALVRIDRAQLLLARGDLQASSYNVDMAKRLKENLASVLKRDGRQKKLIADSKTEHISHARSQAVKASDKYEINGIIRQPVIDYFATVNTIIGNRQFCNRMGGRDIERLAIKVAITPDSEKCSISELQHFSDKDKNDLFHAVNKMLREYGYKLDEGYLRRTIKRLANC
ncbi:hypothetical protein WNY58_09200 [Neptuniibacter pectenicola]|uniref:Uncharacterized protein n=1 Tax=Neptuniibacter pectenicola TaxID=1806669 RepID=A0ABU9TT22_9GAMM